MEKSMSEKVFEVISLSSSFFDVGFERVSFDCSDLTLSPYAKSEFNLERVECGQ